MSVEAVETAIQPAHQPAAQPGTDVLGPAHHAHERHATIWTRIGAITRRDLTLELSYHFQLLLRFARLLFLTTTLYFVSKLVTNPEPLAEYHGKYFEFVVLGFVVTSFVTVGLNAFSGQISEEQRAGTLEMVLSSPTSLPVLLAGSLMVPILLTAAQVFVYVIMAIVIFGADISLVDMLIATPVLALTVATFCAIGIFSASFIVLTKRGDPFTLFAAQAGTLLAGTIFPTSVLPGPLEALTRLIPAYYGLQGVREIVLGNASLGEVTKDMAILLAFLVVLLPLAIWCFSRALRVARVTGTLGNY